MHAGLGVVGGGLGKLPGAEAELWQCLAEVEMQWGGWSTVAQDLGVAELWRHGGSRALGCAGGRVRRKEGRGCV